MLTNQTGYGLGLMTDDLGQIPNISSKAHSYNLKVTMKKQGLVDNT